MLRLIKRGWSVLSGFIRDCAGLGLKKTELDASWLYLQLGLFLSLLSVGCFGLFVLWFSKLLCLTLAGKEPGGLVKRSFSQ